MKRIKQMIIVMTLVIGAAGLFVPATAGAVNVFPQCTATSTDAVCKGKDDSLNVVIKNVVNTMLFILGAVAVIVIIIGGFMYVTSAGDAGGVTKAKNTILYAIIGLVVALLAFAIVNWVVGAVAPSAAQQSCEKAGGTYNTKTKVCKP